MPKGNDLYGTYGSVPGAQSQGVSNANFSVHANPNDFGAQVGEAVSHAGQEARQLADNFAAMSVESKVNDDYATKYVPTALELRKQYDSLRGQDKVAGYEQYTKELQYLNSEFVEGQSGEYGKRIMGGLVKSHYFNEVQGAQRELVESQKAFSDESTYNLLNANNSLAANNYNDPNVIKTVLTQNDNHILKQHLDSGADINSPEQEALIANTQQNFKGEMAVGMINAAVNNRDVNAANNIRSEFSSAIPGYQKLNIDNLIHTENIRQTSYATIGSITKGGQIPEPIGAPPSQVQALVADTAHTSGVDPNHALAVLRIESSDGKNLGTRGTLGQDKESAGKSQDVQAQALCDNLKKANLAASESLGRVAEPWESYVVYQQGVGGGPALLKADDNDKAVDVLTPLYKNPKDAFAAVVNNGGNSTMTAKDFLGHLKQVYDDNAKRANCDFSKTTTPGEAITKSFEGDTVTVQPAATPMQAFINFQKSSPELLAKINSIPNYEVRAGVMRSYNADFQTKKQAASNYTNVLVYKAGQLAADPKFTSMDQVPTELYSALAIDHPNTITLLEKRAEENSKRDTASPLDFTQPATLGIQIAARVTSANALQARSGKPADIFTKNDMQALSGIWQTQSTNERLNLLSTIHESLPNSQDYSKVIQSIRPDSPVTAIAGSFIGIQGKVLTHDSFLDSKDIYVTPDVVAKRLLEGEELLNPTKQDKHEGGTGKVFPMPSDEEATGLRDNFNEYVGDSFRGNPAMYNQAYQAYRAYYAAEASERGIYSGKIDNDVAEIASHAVIGNIVDKNDSKAIIPWGMDVSTFDDKGKVNFDKLVDDNGYRTDIVKWDDVKLQNRAGQSGAYYMIIGNGYLLDKKGQPLTLKVEG